MSLLGAAETTSKEREPDKESASERALDQKLRESRAIFFLVECVFKNVWRACTAKKHSTFALYMYVCI